MSRFPVPAAYDRTHGPAPGSAGDGIHQGASYTGIVSRVPENGEVEVTIPDLSTEFNYRCRIQPKLSVSVGQQCCVLFDSQKIPWVVTGEWTPTILEHGRVEQTSEKTKISAPSVTATNAILATIELPEGSVASSVTNREAGVGFTVWSPHAQGRYINWAVLG